MESVKESLSALSRAILNKAQLDANRVLANALVEAAEIRQQIQKEAEDEREQRITRARQQAEQIRSQMIASAQLKARTMELEEREDVLNDVFEAARQRISTVPQWTNYAQIVTRLAREAVEQLVVSEARIRADKHALEILESGVLSTIAADMDVTLQLGEPLEGHIGVIAETLDGYRTYDNTLEARLERWHQELRFPVYRILRGETL